MKICHVITRMIIGGAQENTEPSHPSHVGPNVQRKHRPFPPEPCGSREGTVGHNPSINTWMCPVLGIRS